jgi:hypothetical protein
VPSCESTIDSGFSSNALGTPAGAVNLLPPLSPRHLLHRPLGHLLTAPRLAKWRACPHRNCGTGRKQHVYANVGCISHGSKRRDWGRAIRPRLSIFSQLAEWRGGWTLGNRMCRATLSPRVCPHCGLSARTCGLDIAINAKRQFADVEFFNGAPIVHTWHTSSTRPHDMIKNSKPLA